MDASNWFLCYGIVLCVTFNLYRKVCRLVLICTGKQASTTTLFKVHISYSTRVRNDNDNGDGDGDGDGAHGSDGDGEHGSDGEQGSHAQWTGRHKF